MIPPHSDHEIWTYELPSLTLRRRQEIGETDIRDSHRLAIAPDGSCAQWRTGEHYDTARLMSAGVWKNLAVAATDESYRELSGEWIVVSAAAGDNLVVHPFDRARFQIRARIALDGATGPHGIRIQNGHLIIYGTGRVLAVSLKTSAVTREHRLTV